MNVSNGIISFSGRIEKSAYIPRFLIMMVLNLFSGALVKTPGLSGLPRIILTVIFLFSLICNSHDCRCGCTGDEHKQQRFGQRRGQKMHHRIKIVQNPQHKKQDAQDNGDVRQQCLQNLHVSSPHFSAGI